MNSKKLQSKKVIMPLMLLTLVVVGVVYQTFFSNPCHKLHKVTSRDDLLKQMYDTAFKDDCLYDMTAAELQAIWQVPVSDNSFRNQYSIAQVGEDYSLNLYPDKSPFDFYVFYFEKGNELIGLGLTKDAWRTGKHTLFSDGYFPHFLGKPEVKSTLQSRRKVVFTNYASKKGDQIQHLKAYEWEYGWSNPRTMEAFTYPYGAILTFTFRNSIQH